MRTIGETAALAGISTRTLRWYEEIGLLQPRARSTGGHRLYGREELLRLREILVWRLLSFPLQDVAALVDDPDHDRMEALCRQRELVSDQHTRFGAILRGLDEVIAAAEDGRPLVDEDVFRGFDVSLSTDELESEPVTNRLRLVDGPRHLPRRAEPDIGRSRRIVATEPIRIGENLLALGVVPVGTGTFWSDTANQGCWPWPELVEDPIRDRVQDLGWYGTNKELVAKARPDLILDLLFTRSGRTGYEGDSEVGRRHEDLCEIAPTVLLDAPIAPPAFLGRLNQLATILSVEDRVDQLAASWEARTAVLREHISGQTVSALNVSPLFRVEHQERNSYDAVGIAPNLDHEAQLFTSLGLSLLPPPEGHPAHWGGGAWVTVSTLGQLSAPTLFLTLERSFTSDNQVWPKGFQALTKVEPFASLPAVKGGRVFDFRWRHMRSGWFSAHCQLDIIARAFGICRLRTAGRVPPLYLGVHPGGRLTVDSTGEDCIAILSGPMIADVKIELVGGVVTDIDIGDAAAHLCTFPEAYYLSIDGDGARRLMHDRESALERVTQRYAA